MEIPAITPITLPAGQYIPEVAGPRYIEAPYRAMVMAFGEPNSTDDPIKTDVAWDLQTPHGRVHVYNYKNGPAYNGPGCMGLDAIHAFSAQGESIAALRGVERAAERAAENA